MQTAEQDEFPFLAAREYSWEWFDWNSKPHYLAAEQALIKGLLPAKQGRKETRGWESTSALSQPYLLITCNLNPRAPFSPFVIAVTQIRRFPALLSLSIRDSVARLKVGIDNNPAISFRNKLSRLTAHKVLPVPARWDWSPLPIRSDMHINLSSKKSGSKLLALTNAAIEPPEVPLTSVWQFKSFLVRNSRITPRWKGNNQPEPEKANEYLLLFWMLQEFIFWVSTECSLDAVFNCDRNLRRNMTHKKPFRAWFFKASSCRIRSIGNLKIPNLEFWKG